MVWLYLRREYFLIIRGSPPLSVMENYSLSYSCTMNAAAWKVFTSYEICTGRMQMTPFPSSKSSVNSFKTRIPFFVLRVVLCLEHSKCPINILSLMAHKHQSKQANRPLSPMSEVMWLPKKKKMTHPGIKKRGVTGFFLSREHALITYFLLGQF